MLVEFSTYFCLTFFICLFSLSLSLSLPLSPSFSLPLFLSFLSSSPSGRPSFRGVAYDPSPENAAKFAADMTAELGVSFEVVDTPEALCGASDAIYTQTPGGSTVLELGWLKPHATIIASGSDQVREREQSNNAKERKKAGTKAVESRWGSLRLMLPSSVCFLLAASLLSVFFPILLLFLFSFLSSFSCSFLLFYLSLTFLLPLFTLAAHEERDPG